MVEGGTHVSCHSQSARVQLDGVDDRRGHHRPILAVLAIPNFLKYQARAKQSEAKTNLVALHTSELAYSPRKIPTSTISTRSGLPSRVPLNCITMNWIVILPCSTRLNSSQPVSFKLKISLSVKAISAFGGLDSCQLIPYNLTHDVGSDVGRMYDCRVGSRQSYGGSMGQLTMLKIKALRVRVCLVMVPGCICELGNRVKSVDSTNCCGRQAARTWGWVAGRRFRYRRREPEPS